MSHIKESTHWYDRNGEPRYTVIGTNGQERPATLRDARKHGWYPGVTSIIRCAAAPGLERWKQEQSILAALTMPRTGDEPQDVLMARIKADADEQAKKARERGTQIHAAIQGHFEGKAPSEEMWPYVKGVIEALAANFGECAWVPEVAVAHPSGFGTKADLSSPFAVVDFKGSDFDAIKAPTLETWDEHHMQLAATGKALTHMDGLVREDFAICYVSRTVPGLTRIIRVDEPEIRKGWGMFESLLAFWQHRCGYYPQQWREKQAA
jgi:hypothetical protein